MQLGDRGRRSKGQSHSAAVEAVEADEEVDTCEAGAEAMDRGEGAGGQQEERSAAAAKHPRSAGGSPDGGPAPRARWDDSDDGDGGCSLPDRPALMLEVQIPFETAAWTGAHACATPDQGSEYKSEASETSGEGSEDQDATQTKPQDPVKLLRQQEDETQEAKNNIALGALYGINRPTVEKILQPQG